MNSLLFALRPLASDFLPTIAFAIVAATGNIYSGLWYPVIVASLTVIVGAMLLPETYRRRAS